MPKLSVIIVTYNSKEIISCIESVYATLHFPFEIIMVDNHSSDDVAKKIRDIYPDVTVIENTTNKGYGTACNQAIKIACGKHILILNPDIILEQNTVAELLSYLTKNKRAKIVSCKLKNADGTTQDSFREFPAITLLLKRQINTRFRTKNNTAKEPSKPCKVDWVSGAFMLLRDKYYFDERFFLYFEDVDLCKTIDDVYYYPHVSAQHTAKRESARNLKLTFFHAQSALRYFLKHSFIKR